MVGKHSSLQPLKRLLAASGMPHSHYFVTTLSQGVTSRWVLAWTFSENAAKGYKKWLVRAQAVAFPQADIADCSIPDSSCLDGSGGAHDSNGGNSNTDSVAAREEILSSIRCGSAEKPRASVEKRDEIFYRYSLRMPNVGLFETMLPSDEDVLTSYPYQKFFSIGDSNGSSELLNSCQDSVSTLTAYTHIATIPLEGVYLNAVSRVVAAVEDTNNALAKDKDALVYQFQKAVQTFSQDVSALGLVYNVVRRDNNEVKAYETIFVMMFIEGDWVTSATVVDWSDYSSTNLVLHVQYDVRNVTGACENWRYGCPYLYMFYFMTLFVL